MNGESIKRELHFGSNKKLTAAFQHLLAMGYSVDDACSILADYREQAADEAEYMDEADQVFNRHLKNIAAGRYEREEIDGHLYYLPDDVEAMDDFNDFMSHMENPYDEYDDEEKAQMYLHFKEPLYEALQQVLARGVRDICRVNMNGHDLMDVIQASADLLAVQSGDEESLKEAVDLCSYVIRNFRFDQNDEYENECLLDLYESETTALNELHEYEKCDAVLDEMEKHTSRGDALDQRLMLMMDRGEKEQQRAGQIAVDAMHDRDFIDFDESSIQFLRAASFVFDELGDEEHLQEAADLLNDRNLPEFDDEDSPVHQMMMPFVLDIIDKALEADAFPNLKSANEKLLKMGFSMEEIRIALAAMILRELRDGEAEEDAEEDALDWLDEEDYDGIEEAVREGELERLEEFTEEDEEAFNNDEEEQKKLASELLEKREEFRSTVKEYIQAAGTNSFREINERMWYDLVDFEDFLTDCADALHDTGHDQECLDFTQFILSSFDFSDDDSSTEDVLKELVVESYDGLNKQKEADQYIDAWMREKPESTRPVWAKLISLDNRGEKEKALRLADQVMKMDLAEGEDTEVLLDKVEEIYEEYGEQEKLQEVREKTDALYSFDF